MPAAKYDLKIEQGADFKESLVLRDDQGVLINLTGYTAEMQIRPYVSSDTVLLNATSANGLISITPAEALIELIFDNATTAALIYTKCVYDLEVTKPSGEVVRLIEGNVYVTPQVTRGT